MRKYLAVLLLFIETAIWGTAAWGKSITTNAVVMNDAPDWVTSSRVEKVVDRIQSVLEWDIRRVTVFWYRDQATFQNVHHYDTSVLAISRKSDNTIHIGPRVESSDFDGVFGHELVHIIIFQKYKDAIPPWLEEGLADYAGRHGHVDYAWLSAQPEWSGLDVHTLTHPFTTVGPSPRFYYMVSTALIEMIAAKCNLEDLLQLSVGKRLEPYLSTTCEIPDINADFRKWVEKKSHRTS